MRSAGRDVWVKIRASEAERAEWHAKARSAGLTLSDLVRVITADWRIATMPHRIFYSVDLAAWVYGTIEKLRPDVSWRPAWVETYREIGGVSTSSGQKSCPMMAARTLYEFGRLKDGGLLFRDCDVSELWDHPGYGRNGAYAILATRLLRKDPKLKRKAPWPEIKKALWPEIQEVVRREVEFDDDDGPASNENDEVRLTWQLWHLGLIVDQSA